MTNPTVLISEDGSTTLLSHQFNTTYHSTKGAVQESAHVYILSGLQQFISRHPHQKEVTVLEIGLGTCLNAALTLDAAINYPDVHFNYVGIEKYPVPESVLKQLHYEPFVSNPQAKILLDTIYYSRWEKTHQLLPNFSFTKLTVDFLDYLPSFTADVVYLDAFDPSIQPEMWCFESLKRLASWMNPNAVLVTFSAKGQVRRDLQQLGFTVERIPGPPGKREIIRATKN